MESAVAVKATAKAKAKGKGRGKGKRKGHPGAGSDDEEGRLGDSCSVPSGVPGRKKVRHKEAEKDLERIASLRTRRTMIDSNAETSDKQKISLLVTYCDEW